MKIKFPALLILSIIGLAAATLPWKWPATPQLNSPPPEQFFGQVRHELNGVAAGNNIPTPSVRVLETASSTDSSTKELSPIKWDCTGANASNFDCYQKYYTGLVDQASIKAAFADLKARYPKDDYTRSMCHPLTHVIGKAASAKFATPGEAYKYGDSFCWSGYYHGVLEGIIGRIGFTNLAGQLDSICADIRDKEGYSFNYYNCVHGLGHGIMAITQDELFDSLALCDKLTGSWEQFSCGSGAYMENIIVDGKNHVTKFLNPSDPLYPCNASPDKYKNTCYLMQTSYMLKVNGRNFAQTFASCSKVESAYRDTCYQSLGRDASGQNTSDVSATKVVCLLGRNAEEQSNCVIGAAKDFVSYFHSDVQAKQFCNAFDDTGLRQICLSTTASYYSIF